MPLYTPDPKKKCLQGSLFLFSSQQLPSSKECTLLNNLAFGTAAAVPRASADFLLSLHLDTYHADFTQTESRWLTRILQEFSYCVLKTSLPWFIPAPMMPQHDAATCTEPSQRGPGAARGFLRSPFVTGPILQRLWGVLVE